jgi:hypothetical protein
MICYPYIEHVKKDRMFKRIYKLLKIRLQSGFKKYLD